MVVLQGGVERGLMHAVQHGIGARERAGLWRVGVDHDAPDEVEIRLGLEAQHLDVAEGLDGKLRLPGLGGPVARRNIRLGESRKRGVSVIGDVSHDR